MYRPLGRNIIIKLDEAVEVNKKGIILPGTISDNSPRKATVVKVGSGQHQDGKKRTFEVKEGDRVLVTLYGGSIFTDDDTLLVVDESDILAIIEEE